MISAATAGMSTGVMDELPLWVWILLALGVMGAILLGILVADARNTLRGMDDVIDATGERGWTLDGTHSVRTRSGDPDPEDPNRSAA